MSSCESTPTNPRRKALSTAVCAVLQEVGFNSAEKTAVETLTEMLLSTLLELARSSRALCELTGRTEALAGDVLLAMIEMGLHVESLSSYAKRPIRTALIPPGTLSRPYHPKILQAGEKRNLPAYIPDHFPPFPDPHAYIRTPTFKQPVTEYEAIREKAASQKRDVERALTRFVAKTGCTQSLFADDTSLFPLIACKPVPNSYLGALLPKDQIFDQEDGKNGATKKKDKPGTAEEQAAAKAADSGSDADVMDNPYLRGVKMPRKRRR